MTHDAQRIAIAEWCGLKRESRGEYFVWIGPGCNYLPHPPDYLHDLNAMWEAEKKIACENWWGYVIALNRKVCEDTDESYNNDPETSFCMVHATASQRAEALLRVIGKWTDTL